MSQFHLAASLQGHKGDVRAVTTFINEENEIEVVTASRDTTIKMWNLKGEEKKNLQGHNHYVTCILSFDSSSHFGFKGLASGGADKIINIWNLEGGNQISSSLDPVTTLFGHENNVVSLSLTSEGLLISGSLDKTAKVWKGTECIMTLEGHEGGVWGVLGLENGDIVTASADKSIRIWKNGSLFKTIQKHSDCVRSLSLFGSLGFLSVGNDGNAYLWTYSGELMNSWATSEVYVYAIGGSKEGEEFASGGEDRIVRIWKGNECIQSITHPASIWSLSYLPNGDLVTGSSDGVARIFSRNEDRKASEEITSVFNASVSNQSLPPGSIGEMEVDKLPGMEGLAQDGKKEGEIKIVRNGDQVEVYSWNQNKWEKVGNMMDAKQSQSKQLMNGKEYDYIFDVDIGDGLNRKLGYNNSENPYATAIDFLDKNDLDRGFLEQVAQFIIQNSKPVTLGASSSSAGYVDPYTGNSGYRSGGPDVQKEWQSGLRSNSSSAPSSSSLPTVDSVMEEAQARFPSKYKQFPLKQAILFDTGNFQTIQSKIVSLNGEAGEKGMNEKETAELNSIVETLNASSRYHASSFSDSQYALLTSKLLRWPENLVFPCLDLFRLFLIHPEGSSRVARDKKAGEIVEILMNNVASSSPANQQLALRSFINLFRFENTRNEIISPNETKILNSVSNLTHSSNNGVRLALFSLLFNFSINLIGKNEPEKIQLLTLLSEILKTENNGDHMIRGLVAVGNLVWNDRESATFLQQLEVIPLFQKQSQSNDKTKEVSLELLDILQKGQ